MRITDITKIIIRDDRQRREFGPEAHQELITSIETTGLMHPPVLREEGGQLILVAGERRLRALSEILELGGCFRCDGQVFQDGQVPYLSLGELSHIEAEEAELDENLRRQDLTWQEHAAAVARLHTLRTVQKEAEAEKVVAASVAKGAPAPATVAHTIADTAEELTGRRDGSYQDTVRKELIVARHLDNEEVSKAKSADEAFKILKRQEERAKNVELARTVGATFNADKHTILNIDCIKFMTDTIADPNGPRFRVIVTDPPYGMGADQFGDAGGKMSGIEHHYDDSYESWQSLMGGEWKFGKPVRKGWCDLSYEICQPQAHAYVFCDFDRFHELKKYMERAGWYVFRTPLVVHKVNSGRVPLPELGPRRQYELVLYAIKGKMPTTHIYPDVIAVSGDDNSGHGAQKPVALYQNLLQRSVRPGDLCADFFAGSGPMVAACHGLKCTATLVEQSQEYYAKCLRRVQDLKSLETAGDILNSL